MKSDITASIIYLKNKVHKWRNIALFAIFFAVILSFRPFFLESKVESITDYIAEIEIQSAIFNDSHRSKILRKLALQNNVKAVLVKINSPGGGIVGSEILYKDLLTISQKKPMVVLMESIATSGAYMAALASDYIVAHNGTLTGSIGVMMQTPNANELAKKIGVSLKSFKSSPVKGYPSITDIENPNYDAIIQSSIDDSHDFFSNLVIKRRGNKLNKNNMSQIFDGRVFTGRQSFKMGLVDKIGFKEDAIAYLLSKNPDLKKLPLKKVSIIEEEKDILGKFINMLPFIKNLESVSQSSRAHGIAAIL